MKNIKSYLLVGIFCSGLTLGAYKIAGFDNQPVVITEAASANTGVKFTSGATGPGALPVDFTFAAEKTTPAVVHIQSTVVSNRSVQNLDQLPDVFKDFFGDELHRQRPSGPQKSKASGSGVIFSSDGYIITNNHVVEDASEVEVILYDKRSFKAKVIGTDPSTDLAVLQIKASNLPFLVLANSDDVKVGQWVLAVGNPFNLESTVTAGIVSAKGRNIGILVDKERERAYNQDPAKPFISSSIESFIQTDAAVNPGNSGGALVNLQGELIGINTAIATPTGTFAGYSFAVPTGIVKKVAQDLLTYGTVQRGYLGVSIRSLDGKLATEKNIGIYEGVYVDGLAENGSAKSAGIKEGDVIVKIDGISVRSSSELQELIARHKPGEKVVVTLNREGKEKEMSVELKTREGKNEIVKRDEKADLINSLGVNFQELTEKEKKDLRLSSGIKVTKLLPGKLRSETDMREGFIITKVNGKPVSSLKELTAMLESKKGSEDGVMLQGIYPDLPGNYYYAFGL
ncbi:MAG: Do family serine endopeptidase [Bacteroidota bacterium]